MLPIRRAKQQKKLWKSLLGPFSATSRSQRVETAYLPNVQRTWWVKIPRESVWESTKHNVTGLRTYCFLRRLVVAGDGCPWLLPAALEGWTSLFDGASSRYIISPYSYLIRLGLWRSNLYFSRILDSPSLSWQLSMMPSLGCRLLFFPTVSRRRTTNFLVDSKRPRSKKYRTMQYLIYLLQLSPETIHVPDTHECSKCRN